MKCKICERICKDYGSLGRHLKKHNISKKEYYDKYFKSNDEDICDNQLCKNKTKFKRLSTGYRKFCSCKCHVLEKHPMKNKNHSIKSRSKMRNSHIGIPLSKTHRKNIIKSITKAFQKPEYKNKRRLIALNNWKDLKYQQKVISGVLKALNHKTNLSEKLLLKILNKTLPKEYKFVGNGKFTLERFCPDFINTNGQKKIIELYGDYWHNKKEVISRDKRRLKVYKKYGYKTLIVWDKELKNKEKLIEKILKFNRR